MTFRVNVKACPRCKEKVDKNGGCNAMSCRCGHHFCWLCLQSNPYSAHRCKEVPLQVRISLQDSFDCFEHTLLIRSKGLGTCADNLLVPQYLVTVSGKILLSYNARKSNSSSSGHRIALVYASYEALTGISYCITWAYPQH